MRKTKSQTTEGLWATDWWEIADGITAVVRKSSEGTCLIKVKASVPSPLHVVNASLPVHWQKGQSTDITKIVAAGRVHDIRHLLRSGGITMQADGVEDCSIEVDSMSIESTLLAIAENYTLMAKV